MSDQLLIMQLQSRIEELGKENNNLNIKLTSALSRAEQAESERRTVLIQIRDLEAKANATCDELQKRAEQAEARVKELLCPDGSWLDKYGSCRACGGEIPHGHSKKCDIYRIEQRLTLLENALSKAEEVLAMCRELEGTNSASYDPDEYNTAIDEALTLITSAKQQPPAGSEGKKE